MTLAYMHDNLVICMEQEAYIISKKKKNIRRPCRQKVRVDYLHFQLDQSCQWVFNWSHTHMYVCNQSIQRSYRHRIIASLFNFNVCQNNLIEMEEMNSMNDI